MNKIREVLYKMHFIQGIKDKFQDKRIPDCQSFYDTYISAWKNAYTVDKIQKDWLRTHKKTVLSPGATKRTRDGLNMAKILCEELAGLIFNEECTISVSSDQKKIAQQEDDPLDTFVQDVLQRNSFWSKFQNLIEMELALGGAAIKLSHDGEREIKFSYLMADQFIPVGWTNRGMTEGVFVTQEKRDRYYYTLFEWHLLKTAEGELKRELEYNLFESSNTDHLGVEIDVKRVYPELEPVLRINRDVQTFVYFAPNTANNADFALPLGISVFANALDTLKQLDIAFDSFGREFVLGKKRIIVPAAAIREVVVPGIDSEPLRYFDADDEVYEAFDFDKMDSFQIQDNTVVLRVEEHVKAINALLNILCMQTGLTAGTFSFDVAQGVKTATEIISANSKTYKTIKGHQNLIREAIESVVRSIIEYGKMYGQIPESATYTVTVGFDDSIVTDKNADIDNVIKLTSAGLMSKRRALMELNDWPAEKAEEELQQIHAEASVPSTDRQDIFGQE
ncbi:MAG TPA: phage portal protein [Bacillota bacterium]|nr:phage portal protein [Bacillota bacterium]